MKHLCTIVLTLAALALLGRPAARAAAVLIVPPDTTVTVGDDFTVRLLVDAIPDLKAAHIVLGIDPTFLSLVSLSPGDVFTSPGGAYAALAVPDVAPHDSIVYDEAMLDGTSHGPGILAFVTLHAGHETAATPVQCLGIDIRDSQNHQTLPPCTGSIVHIVGPTPVRPTTWGRLKVLYRQ